MKYIGVDFHVRSFTVAYVHKQAVQSVRKFPSSRQGMELFLSTVSCFDDLAIEASGISDHFIRLVKPHVHQVVPVATTRNVVIGQSYKKTDAFDASQLALGLVNKTLPLAHLRSEKYQQIATLLRTRHHLTSHERKLKQLFWTILIRNEYVFHDKIPLYSYKFIKNLDTSLFNEGEASSIEVIKKFIAEEHAQSLQMDKTIHTLLKDEKDYQIISAIPGFGIIRSAEVLSTIDNINRFAGPKNLVSYLGLAPISRISDGVRYKKRVPKPTHKYAKMGIVMAVRNVVKDNQSLFQFYQTLRNRRTPAVARSAVARKLVHFIYHALNARKVVTNFDAVNFNRLDQTFDL